MTNADFAFITRIHNELTQSLDFATSAYFLTESAHFAQTCLESLTPTELLDPLKCDEILNQLIEPACTFSPLPASIADFDELALIALADTTFRFLTNFFITHDFRQNAEMLELLETLHLDISR